MTLNQILIRLERLALSHKQLHHFYFGDVVQWLANGDVKYPACFVDVTTGSIDRAERLTSYNFNIMFCDLADVAESAKENEIEVLSDLTSIAEDFKAMLGSTDFEDGEIADLSQLTFFKEKFEDVVLAVGMTATIQARFENNRCQVPAEGVTFETPTETTNVSIVNNYVYRGLGTEGNSLTIGTLVGKTVLWVEKGDKLLVTEAADALSENGYAFNAVNGDFDFGTDIELNQVIQILYR